MDNRVIDCEETSIRLRTIMEQRNESVKNLQKALGLGSVQAVYKWLDPKVKSIPSLDNLVRLADHFECGLDDLLVYRYL